MYRLWCWCTVYLSGGGGRRGHLDWQVLRAPQYVNPALPAVISLGHYAVLSSDWLARLSPKWAIMCQVGRNIAVPYCSCKWSKMSFGGSVFVLLQVLSLSMWTTLLTSCCMMSGAVMWFCREFRSVLVTLRQRGVAGHRPHINIDLSFDSQPYWHCLKSLGKFLARHCLVTKRCNLVLSDVWT